MDAEFTHKSATNDALPAERVSDGDAGVSADSAGLAGRACCCTAGAAVRVTMPPGPSRQHSTELLLCGHHYRVSRQALAVAGAVRPRAARHPRRCQLLDRRLLAGVSHEGG